MRKSGRGPNYEIIKVTVGVHIDDDDWRKDAGEKTPGWGSLPINGKTEGDAPCGSLMVNRISFHV